MRAKNSDRKNQLKIRNIYSDFTEDMSLQPYDYLREHLIAFGMICLLAPPGDRKTTLCPLQTTEVQRRGKLGFQKLFAQLRDEAKHLVDIYDVQMPLSNGDP